MTRTQIGKDARRPNGFTLIELVIVIAVIAILAGLLVPTILGQAERARLTKAKADTNELAKALARMRTDTANETKPCYETLSNLTLAAAPAACDAALRDCRLPALKPGERCWNGPYVPVTTAFEDPWNQPYTAVYAAPPGDRSITVTSPGPDKDAATAADNQVSSQ